MLRKDWHYLSRLEQGMFKIILETLINFLGTFLPISLPQ